ncbi:MAG: ribosome-associated translation inhibitor RaiA [Bacteroidia bacterium]|nr:ribosome-associated translation inhibitor RaiA [Bacteroidia bacterium]MCX7652831.1 ribosome-associated translation inhibitor RaiA [Bacteroidia bacterium]MDW8415939.1 ribosome-associated translation inhibitor RaiA [Bacteroidia bacterium]
MRYKIHHSSVKVSPTFAEYAGSRMERLLHDFAFILHADIYLHEIGLKSPTHEVRLRVQVPGETLIAEEKADNFQEAFDAALNAVRRQLTRYKETIRS